MTKAATTRKNIVAYCTWGIANAARIHYAQVRPIPLATPKKLPLVTDCSGFATLAYKQAGGTNPNTGKAFTATDFLPNSVMYTGTMMRHGKLVAVPLPGDLIFYGEWPGHHVVVFMYEWHGAWVCCSHGQEIGPLRILQHREEIAQPGPRTIRSYLPRPDKAMAPL